MHNHNPLRKPLAIGAALLTLFALGTGTGTNANANASDGSSTVLQRGPLNENYNPPMWAPTNQVVYKGTPDNPLVRQWGVYQGLAEHAWLPYLAASADQKLLLDKIVQRPKATWFGHWHPDSDIKQRVEKYIQLSTGGDPDVLVQVSIFRMVPWETDACKRLPTTAEQESYKRWFDGFAAGVGDAHLAVIMQPDGPFALCAPNKSKLPSHLIRYGVRKLSALPNTSVYIDAGAADWQRSDPREALRMLLPAGIREARGFALNSTHYDSTGRQVRFAAAISRALARRGIPGKYGVINTAANGRPFKGYANKGKIFAKARACRSVSDRLCVTLGIPPTVDVGNPKWGMSATTNALAKKYVDGYLWFGRPWLYLQIAPFQLGRALALSRSTPF